jgi:hypothetical protein
MKTILILIFLMSCGTDENKTVQVISSNESMDRFSELNVNRIKLQDDLYYLIKYDPDRANLIQSIFDEINEIDQEISILLNKKGAK